VVPGGLALPDLARFFPSFRSVLAGVALLVGAGLAYVGARETSVFAVRSVEVHGGTPVLRAEVRAALRPELGRSLLRVNGSVIGRAIADLPSVGAFTYDRDFPHTLRVLVRPEPPVLILRRVPGDEAYLVSASGRVLRAMAHPLLSSLPRLWVTHDVDVTVGANLSPTAAAAARAVAPLHGAPLPTGVKTVQVGSELTLILGSGFEVRLGDPGDIRLKLAIARRLLRSTGAALGPGYLDVSVPARPVLNTNPQVSSGG
jgi:hypothetical protein